MIAKKMFFISLLILSLAMGADYFKNPSRKRRIPQKQQEQQTAKKPEVERTVLALKDLGLDLEEEEDYLEEEPGETEKPQKEEKEEAKTETSTLEEQADSKTEEQKPTTQPIASSEGFLVGEIPFSDPLANDPVIQSIAKMKNTPFQESPYIKIIAMLKEEEEKKRRQQEEKQEEVLRVRKVASLNGKFTATIRIGDRLCAIIDSDTYEKGDIYQNRKITDITDELVIFEEPEQIWLIPKTGVRLDINTNYGTYTFDDSFRK
ncbi:MAG: hypothetical protein GX221_07135 [Candidatus Riflebacteria bacterium]|nr:hypothetical protein [Candidatus Riflebacteria bacterium]